MTVTPELRIDPELLSHGEEDPHGPMIQVIVALTFPGLTQVGLELGRDLAVTAFDEVRACGGRPRLVDAASVEGRDIAELCDDADALLFLGGSDVDLSCYGYVGKAPRGYYGADRDSDEFCCSVMREATQRDLPVLAFCKGSQLLNVAFGGTLIPDIADWGIHRGPGGDALMLDEPLTLVADSRLAEVYGRTEIVVRNGHHQAVDRVATALRAVAHAADGIVEATEHRSANWVIGVQWHPEEREANVHDRRLIFSALVERGRAFRDARLGAVAEHHG